MLRQEWGQRSGPLVAGRRSKVTVLLAQSVLMYPCSISLLITHRTFNSLIQTSAALGRAVQKLGQGSFLWL